MATVLFKHEQITTTKAKAIEVRRVAEKMITRAKEDSVHNRRLVVKRLRIRPSWPSCSPIFGPRMKERNGGYTRILKIGFRDQDAASMVILELVDHELEDTSKADKKKDADKSKKAGPKSKKSESKVDPKAKMPRTKKSATAKTAE